MDRNTLLVELKSKLIGKLKKFNDSSLNAQIKRDIDLIDQETSTKSIISFEDFKIACMKNLGRYAQVITKNGNVIEFMIDPSQVSVDESLRNFSRKFSPAESEPALLHQDGLYLVEPHGELIWSGKKNAIVKSIKIKRINEPLYLLSGKYCYGIIRVKEPKAINIEQFRKLSDSHRITETERLKWWPNYDILYYYPIEFIRRWEVPKEWKFQKGAQIFVKDVKFSEESESAKFLITIFENKEYGKEDETREEGIESEMATYGDWYKVTVKPGKTYRYVAQHHIRGDSVHTDLRIEVNDHLIGWTLDTPGSVSNPKHDKFLDPLSPSQGVDYQNLVERKLIQPKVWLTVKGTIPAGGIGATKYKEAEIKVVSSGRIKFGVQKHDFHEYFLYPDQKWNQSKIQGRWIAALIPRPTHYERAGEGKNMWAMWRLNDQRPYVEYQDYDESVDKAKKEKGYLVWQHPDKGILKESQDFRTNKKDSWVYK